MAKSCSRYHPLNVNNVEKNADVFALSLVHKIAFMVVDRSSVEARKMYRSGTRHWIFT
jgi:hypothetical protein